jgi:glycosyltransferase involved in cell wall biosynthesis
LRFPRHKRKMIKIAYFSLDDVALPSPVIRVIAPNELLRPTVALLGGHIVSNNRVLQDPAAIGDADIILVQRGFPRHATRRTCDLILSSGKPVIYETDDALQFVPAHHKKPIYNDDVGPTVEKFVGRADLVTVSTPALAEIFQPLTRQVVVLPNYLSPNLWGEEIVSRKTTSQNRVRIGFVGSKNHDRDFATLVPLLKEALAKYPDVEVISFGGISGGLEGLARFSVIPPHYDYVRHPKRLATTEIDIAICPLEPSEFNRCKSNIKFLEFGFLAIPGVFADLEPYRQSVVHGVTGFLCDTDLASWRDALFNLIEDADLRGKIGTAARKAVRSSWMLHEHNNQWPRAYDLAIKSHRFKDKTI